jgi:biopolymer transport protein ExbB
MLEWFFKGGPAMYPLLACSVAALAIVIERSVNLRLSKALRGAVSETVDSLVESGVYDKAAALCRQNPAPYTSMVAAVLENRGLPPEEVKELVAEAGRHEMPHLTRYLPALSTITSISPLLGLLGTVLGMVRIFQAIAQQGGGGRTAAVLSSGISEALITTVTGLCIAIPALVFHNYFQNRAEAIGMELEKRILRLMRRVSGDGGAGGAR